MKKLALLIACIMAVSLTAAPKHSGKKTAKADKPSITGKWQHMSMGDTMYLTFTKKGTFTYTGGEGSTGTYKVTGNKIKFDSKDERFKEAEILELTKDVLRLKMGGLQEGDEVYLERAKDEVKDKKK
jgi:uncharacterized protein (TIGR03066 family)